MSDFNHQPKPGVAALSTRAACDLVGRGGCLRLRAEDASVVI